ncbi:hypothetical protein ABTX35_03575 [Streptomyces sp. NPDC096080]|uniref:hypothetical protein n=1 Tax=Streptomyces sp. NPDC096080 TaxID=3156693 RepID=UPI0033291931
MMLIPDHHVRIQGLASAGPFAFPTPDGGPAMDLSDLQSRLWTAQEAAEAAGVEPNTVRNWKYRGHLPQARTESGRPMTTPAGQPLFRATDVIRAERTTRARARRTYGMPATTTV